MNYLVSSTQTPFQPVEVEPCPEMNYPVFNTQPPFQPVEVAHHSSSFLGFLGYPPSYINNPEIGDSEIELELLGDISLEIEQVLETSRGAVSDFTLLQ